MHPNETLLTQFYEAFAKRDFATMAACYHPEATFQDPVFTLEGLEVAAMWHMLNLNARDFSLTFNQIKADDQMGSAHWEARYLFSGTGRPVHNRINASFTFKDGKISSHRDIFSFWSWARQALGSIGLLLGATDFMRKRVQTNARKSLNGFIAKHPEYQK